MAIDKAYEAAKTIHHRLINWVDSGWNRNNSTLVDKIATVIREAYGEVPKPTLEQVTVRAAQIRKSLRKFVAANRGLLNGERKITPGPCTFSELQSDHDKHCVAAVWGPDGDQVAACYDNLGMDVEGLANAEIFAEALTVVSETGLTPREFKTQWDELLLACETLVSGATRPTGESSGFICGAWKHLSDGCVARCDSDQGHEGSHRDSVILVGWEESDAATASFDTRAFQKRVRDWTESRLGKAAMAPAERCRRALEELLELGQILGIPKKQVLRLVIHVYRKPIGNLHKELGDAAITLLGCAEGAGCVLSDCADTVMRRNESLPPSKFQERQKINAALGIGEEPTL